MILVDTSVWVDHLRSGDAALSALLEVGRVAVHPFVVGELACGNLRNRAEVLGLMGRLPTVTVAAHDEVMFFIQRHALMGHGIGYVDACLLASAVLDGRAWLWTRDRRLVDSARLLKVAFEGA